MTIAILNIHKENQETRTSSTTKSSLWPKEHLHTQSKATLEWLVGSPMADILILQVFHLTAMANILMDMVRVLMVMARILMDMARILMDMAKVLMEMASPVTTMVIAVVQGRRRSNH